MRLLSVDEHDQRADTQVEMDLTKIGKRVRVRRVEKEMTQQALATAAGVALGTIQALEDAKQGRKTKLEKLEKIAEALDTTIENLARGTERIMPTDPLLEYVNREALEIARAYTLSSSAVRAKIRILLRDADVDPVIQMAERFIALGQQSRSEIEALIVAIEAKEAKERKRPKLGPDPPKS